MCLHALALHFRGSTLFTRVSSMHLIHLTHLMAWLIYSRRKLLRSSRNKIRYFLVFYLFFFFFETDLRVFCMLASTGIAAIIHPAIKRGRPWPFDAGNGVQIVEMHRRSMCRSRNEPRAGKSISGAEFAAHRHVYLPDVSLVDLRRVNLRA